MMEYKNIVKEMVEIFENSQLASMDVEVLGLRLSLNKDSKKDSLDVSKKDVLEISRKVAKGKKEDVSEEKADLSNLETVEEKKTLGDEVVKAPLVGTVYFSPEPNKPTFVKEGSKVKEGESMCIIEAMKMMNELKAPYDLVVKSILVENAQMVEYGQSIFEVEKC